MAQYRHSSEYVYGSTARKPVPVEKEVPKLRQVKKDESYAVNVNNRRRMHVNAMYTFVMIVALIMVFFVCLNYLGLQSEVSQKSDTLATLEQSYSKLKSDNDFMEVYIESSIDYEYILDVAINELGMVYANSNQVISYESEEIEYVKQFADIPQ